MFKFAILEKNAGVISLEKPGRITGETSTNFRKWYRTEEIGKCSYVIIDGDNIQFIDSMGIAALISIYKDLAPHDGNLILMNFSTEIKRLLGTLRLDRLFSIRDCSLEEILKSL